MQGKDMVNYALLSNFYDPLPFQQSYLIHIDIRIL